MAPNLKSIRTVIVDEVHAMCDNKRGVHLAVSLERLHEWIGRPFQRIGCSATLSPLDEIAAYLAGSDSSGKQRPCTIVDAGMRKKLDVQVVAPLPDFLEAGHNALWTSAYELLLSEIAGHDTTLVFSNSRYKAERTSLRLGELQSATPQHSVNIGVHHGSMSKEIRLEAEDDLKAGKLDALIATSSLELGIDVGSINLVYQLESTKSVATGLQRIGRAGHLLDRTSKGRILVFERDDLLEAGSVCKAMMDGEIDAIQIPAGCLDVLAQQIVGAVAFQDWQANDLLKLIRQAYPYQGLSEQKYEMVLSMLAGDFPFEMSMAPKSLLHWDRATGRLSAGRSSAHISAMCVGTISDASEYDVVIDSSKKRVGRVQSEFVDDCLRVGDVFVLGSTAWRVTGVRRNQLLVKEAPGSTPTVPWWHGHVEPRTVEVGERIGRMRREIAERIDNPDVTLWLEKEYQMCPNAARAAVDYVHEQVLVTGMVPTHDRLLLEIWRDELGKTNLILHSPFGERINRTWGAAISAAAKNDRHENWSAAATNDLLLLTLQKNTARQLTVVHAKEMLSPVTSDTIEKLAVQAADDGGIFGSTFREVAVNSFQILRAYGGKRVPFWLQNYRAGELFEASMKRRDYPVIAEVLRVYLEEALDVPGLKKLLNRIQSGEAEMIYRQVESPSPFTHSMLVKDMYRGDYQMGRDRRANLLRVHRQVLQQVLNEEQMADLLDSRAIERVELRLLHRSEASRARSPDELASAIRDLGDPPASVSALQELVDGDAAAMLGQLLKDGRIVACEVPDVEMNPIRLVSADLWREYHEAFTPTRRGKKLQVILPRLENGEFAGFDAAPADKHIPARWRRKVSVDEARLSVIERYLKCRGPVTLYELANHTGWPAGTVERILSKLVDAGTVAQGVYRSDKPRPQWVNKANLEGIHQLTLGYLKRELAACAPYEVVDFMIRWQHLHPTTRLEGLDGLRQVIRQLQGFELLIGAIEPEMLAGRIRDYSPQMLERLIASGEVSWQRVGDGVKRGRATLCFRKDATWLGAAVDRKYDVLKGADADIANVIADVRAFFSDNPIAFFDEAMEATGHDEGAVMRAVWYLAWCGEMTCDSYECVRHSDFQSTLSGCYDLYSTPDRIVTGKIAAEDVVERMKRRKLDPRLGRWSATELLSGDSSKGRMGVPPVMTGETPEVIQHWTQQLLQRWGILSREFLIAEAAAPTWQQLVPELKRLELLGKVNRGFFIESHHGEQYGLPEAIELLRECRARRSDGKELGYLPDEAVFCITNRDPANLYTRSLDIIEERGSHLQRSMKAGNVYHRMVIQAGQVLLFQGGTDVRQLVTLSRKQLDVCVGALMHDFDGSDVALNIGRWNGYPVDVSPVSKLLHRLGFRFDKPDRMTCPAPGRPLDVPLARPEQAAFLPYYEEPSPIQVGPDWTLSRASDAVRPVLQQFVPIMTKQLERPGWELTWNLHGPHGRYREFGRYTVHVRQKVINVTLSVPRFREEGKNRGYHRWLSIKAKEGIREDLVPTLREWMQQVEELTDHYYALQDSFSEGQRAASQERSIPMEDILINRAPVLTLWGAVAAERLGYDEDASLTLGKCLAGLNAQTKGRMLGIYGQPKGPDGGPPKKVGLGEEFWVEICGRPLPAKNTEDGIRAVIKDKPIDPASVDRYIASKFGDHLDAARKAMTELAESFTVEEFQENAYELYEQFRPVIPRGKAGWGAKGKLDLALIRSLVEE